VEVDPEIYARVSEYFEMLDRYEFDMRLTDKMVVEFDYLRLEDIFYATYGYRPTRELLRKLKKVARFRRQYL